MRKKFGLGSGLTKAAAKAAEKIKKIDMVKSVAPLHIDLQALYLGLLPSIVLIYNTLVTLNINEE